MTYKEIKEALKGLINENTSEADVEKIGNIANEIDKAEEEHNELLTKNETLREKYINAVRNSAFNDEPKEAHDDDVRRFLFVQFFD